MYKRVIGGAAPDHCLPFPEEDDDDGTKLKELLQEFLGEKPKRKLATEIKVALIVFQHSPEQVSPMVAFAARPQTKNEASDFLEICAMAMKEAETCLRKNGWRVSFVSGAVDGVSVETKAVQKCNSEFLRGIRTFLLLTDTNHNEKNGRYQIAIGGNKATSLGCYVIDVGLLKASGIATELYIIKDFASDLLVLKLCSPSTLRSILNCENQELQSKLVFCHILYWMRVHLYAVNTKSNLGATKRVVMVWSALLVFIHCDGVSVITKRNRICEAIALSFLMLRKDVVRPWRLTSEPSEHFFAICRYVVNSFTVNDFLSIVRRQERFRGALKKGRFNLKREKPDGYQSNAVDYSSHGRGFKGGPVAVPNTSDNIDLFGIDDHDDWSVASHIWKVLNPILVKTSKSMKIYLEHCFQVREFHPLLEIFVRDDNTTLNELDMVFKRCAKETDDRMFKKEDQNVDIEVAGDNDECQGLNGVMEEEVSNIGEEGEDVEENGGEELADLQYRMAMRLRNDVIEDEKRSTAGKDDVRRKEANYNEDASVSYNKFVEFVAAASTSNHLASVGSERELLASIDTLLLDKSREKGDVTKARGIKSLTQRWFEGKKEKPIENNKSKGKVIKRGSVISIGGAGEESTVLYLVLGVFKDRGNKWYLSKKGEDPQWPLIVTEKKMYRVLIRKVVEEKSEDGQVQHGRCIRMMKYNEEIVDGENTRKCYKLESISVITELKFEISI